MLPKALLAFESQKQKPFLFTKKKKWLILFKSMSTLSKIITKPSLTMCLDVQTGIQELISNHQNQFLSLELILREVKIFYFLSDSFLEELSNINHFTSKSILQKQNQIRTYSMFGFAFV